MPELYHYFQQLINGLTVGSTYALIAIGYTMVYGIIGMINFAHGEVYMIGSYVTFIALIGLSMMGLEALPLLMIGAFGWALAERPLLSVDVTKDRTLYRENSQGQIENMYSLKVINKTQQHRQYAVSLDAGPFQLQGARELHLAPGEIVNLPLSVALVDDTSGRGLSRQLQFEVHDLDDPASVVRANSTFIAPANR